MASNIGKKNNPAQSTWKFGLERPGQFVKPEIYNPVYHLLEAERVLLEHLKRSEKT